MAGGRTKKRALWLATETTYGQDASVNGSGYRWVPTRQLGLLVDGRAPIRTDYFTGRNFPTAPIQGPDGASFDFRMPIWGLAAAAGDGAAVGAADVLDQILLHILATQVDVVGEGLDTGSGSSTLELDAAAGALQGLVPVFEADVPSAANGGARTQWAKIISAAAPPTYGIAPNWTQNPSTSAVAYGRKQYRPADGGGATLDFVYQLDDKYYTLLGARCTRAVLEWTAAGGMIELATSWRCDSKTEETATKTALPAVGAAPPATPIRATLSPFFFGGTKYPVGKCSIDLGVTAAIREATEGANGRGEDESISVLPRITVNPLRDDAFTALKRAGSSPNRLLVQLGAGVLSGGVLNTMCFEAEYAGLMEDPLEDDSGRMRQSLVFEVFDKVVFDGSTLVDPVFQLARA
jgi:hypothetical protein